MLCCARKSTWIASSVMAEWSLPLDSPLTCLFFFVEFLPIFFKKQDFLQKPINLKRRVCAFTQDNIFSRHQVVTWLRTNPWPSYKVMRLPWPFPPPKVRPLPPFSCQIRLRPIANVPMKRNRAKSTATTNNLSLLQSLICLQELFMLLPLILRPSP